MQNCPTCKGKKEVTITVHEWGKKKSTKEKIPCSICDGKGKVSNEKAKEIKRMQDSWCTCGNPSGESSYFNYDGCHGYNCIDCGKLLQIG